MYLPFYVFDILPCIPHSSQVTDSVTVNYTLKWFYFKNHVIQEDGQQ